MTEAVTQTLIAFPRLRCQRLTTSTDRPVKTQVHPSKETLISKRHRSTAGVVLTYNAQSARDGLGAQMQRLMGIYSASHELGLGYFHNPIQFIEKNPGDPDFSTEERCAYLNEVNALVDLPGLSLSNTKLRLPLSSLTTRRARLLQFIHRVAKAFGVTILVPLPSSLPWSDAFPDTYQWAAQIISPRIGSADTSSVATVDVHIRRAVSPAQGRDGEAYDRYVPTAWYSQVLETVVPFFQQKNIPSRIRIHTDIPSERWKVPADTSAGTLAMWQHHGFVDGEGYLVDFGEDLRSHLSQFGPIETAQEWSPLDALTSMVQADILIICASSFSYVAGLLRATRLTVSPYFFHQTPSHWQLIPTDMCERKQQSLRKALRDQFH